MCIVCVWQLGGTHVLFWTSSVSEPCYSIHAVGTTYTVRLLHLIHFFLILYILFHFAPEPWLHATLVDF